MKNIVILGAGTAGTMMSNKLRRMLPAREWDITVVDRDGDHVYQPGLLFLPFNQYRDEEITRPRESLLDPGISLVLDEIERISPPDKRVVLKSGHSLRYDVLVIATGTRIQPAMTPGLAGRGWHQTAFDFYTVEGARALRGALDRFEGGRIAVHIVEMPIKCPVAPLEFTFLADAFFTQRGMRSKVELTYVTPLEGAFTKPRASQAFGGMLQSRGVQVVGDFAVQEVDGERGILRAYDGREVPYDLLVTIPLHTGSEAVMRSELGDAAGFVPTHKHTLQATAIPDTFVLGDATNLPASKAGAVAHFQAEVLADNIVRYVRGAPLVDGFDGHANCFIETGHGKAMLIDFNYDTEPLPGRFPLPGVGPFTLLEESRVNHWGKLGFKWVYWNMLLRGEELPLDHRMVMAGKWS